MTAVAVVISILKIIPEALVLPYRLLSPPLKWLLSPLIVLLHSGARLFSLLLYGPLSIISRFETLYIYCGSAAIIGGVIGSLVALLSYSLASAFRILGSSPSPSSSPSSTSASPFDTPSTTPKSSSSRKGRRAKTADIHQYQSVYASGLTLRPGFSHPVPTILEEEEEDSQVDAGRRRRPRFTKRRTKKAPEGLSLWLDDAASGGDAISDDESSF